MVCVECIFQYHKNSSVDLLNFGLLERGRVSGCLVTATCVDLSSTDSRAFRKYRYSARERERKRALYSYIREREMNQWFEGKKKKDHLLLVDHTL